MIRRTIAPQNRHRTRAPARKLDRETLPIAPGAPERIPGMVAGVKAGGFLFFSAIRGRNPMTNAIDIDPGVQARQALRNILAILACDGARAEHVVRLTWYVIDRADYLGSGQALGEAYREVMGTHFPAMTAVQVTALMESGALVEIEGTAVVPDVP